VPSHRWALSCLSDLTATGLLLANIGLLAIGLLDVVTFVAVIVDGSKYGLGLYLALMPLHAAKILTLRVLSDSVPEDVIVFENLHTLAFVCLGSSFWCLPHCRLRARSIHSAPKGSI
jgi:hypothetical protein